ncbi:hypothetical protein [Pandoraea cepalis]|uniref:CesD/SycD/LcrH family type III secretion system chaperone n=1 Tax=Pandoraea cepalis TaxID=2508294 RepID=A0A5E4U0Z1_9BURK|nr:hypothetical protein [Pandoraea cepalis]VVD91819.1 hypothetical protein PCE31107_01664 [Pandoraea cepalis]
MQRYSAPHATGETDVRAGRIVPNGQAHPPPRTDGAQRCATDAASPNVSPTTSPATSSIDSPIASQAFSHAYALCAANDFVGAARAFADLCLAYPERTDAYKAFGYVLCQLGDYRHAVAPLMIAVARDYGDPEPLYFAAVCMQRNGDVDTARDMAGDALDMVRRTGRPADLHDKLTRLIDAL